VWPDLGHSGMVGRLGELLDDARRRGFVGRDRQVAAFRAALAGEGPCRVFFVFGPGGIGKTTLLGQFRLLADEAGRRVVNLDGRERALRSDDLADAVADLNGSAAVVLIDGYEQLASLDGFVRERWMPELPGDAVVVLAGREPPVVAWQADPGWRAVVAVEALGPLAAAEASELLVRAGVDGSLVPRLSGMARGHPLALALLAAAARRGRVPRRLREAPEIVAALVPLLIADELDEDQVRGLELCAHVHLLTVELLEELLGDRAGAVWEWLAGLAFISVSARGLHPHDLAREVLEAEFLRRFPDGRRRSHSVVRRYALRGLRDASATEQLRVAQQLQWLHRQALQYAAAGLSDDDLVIGAGRYSDHEAAVHLIDAELGGEQARLAEAWLAGQPEGLVVGRRGEDLAAMSLWVTCPAVATDLDARDPIISAIRAHIDEAAPLRPGEEIGVGRFSAPIADHADTMTVGGTAITRHFHLRRRSWTWMVIYVAGFHERAAQFYDPMFVDYMGFPHRLRLGPFVAYGMDWRRVPFEAWYAEIQRRGLTGDLGPLDPGLFRPPPLDHAAFAAAVKDALRDLTRPNGLGASPLVGTELGVTPAGPDPERVRELFHLALDELRAQPSGAKLHAVIDRTFLHPAPSQEAAAEVLGLPFSTYRRRLAAGIDRITDTLWDIELGNRYLDPSGGS
jgi:hypothetical protein